MDRQSDNLRPLLDILVAKRRITGDEAKTLLVREDRLRTLVKHEKGGPTGRYEASAVELILAAKATDPSGALLDEEQIMEDWASALGLRYQRIDPLKLDAKLITDTFNQAFARHNLVLPLGLSNGVLTLATSRPDFAALERMLHGMFKYSLEFVLTSKTAILRSISEIYGFRTSVKAAASAQTSNSIQAQLALGNLEQLVSIRQLEDIDASDSHIINAVDYLLNYAFGQRASDIHIEPHREQSIIRLRIDGVLHIAHKLPIVVHSPIVSRLKTLARMDIAEKRRPQDGRIKTEHQGQEIELRVSTMPVAFGEKMVIRIFDAGKLFQSLDDLGLEPADLLKFRHMLAARTGLILVTGPTGSGKTTTLYSALKSLYSPELNITTVEDPVEMVYEDFNQVQVQPKIGLDFLEALRTVLRQDPDIIMVGEIRDEQTAHMAVQAALTGHLVLSTLHTNDAPSATTRLLDLGVAPFLLSSCFLGCLAQRLVRRVCDKCSSSEVLSAEMRQSLGIRLPSTHSKELRVNVGQGCDVCRQTGTYGQCGIFEVMPVSANLRRLIHKGAGSDEIGRTARADGMLTLYEAAIAKLGQGIIPSSEVLRVLGLLDA